MNDYFQQPGLSSGQIQKFMVSPAHAKQPVEPMAVFGVGHYFEELIEDSVTGSTHCRDKYMVCDITGTINAEILSAIERGATVEELNAMEKLTQKKERSLTHKNYHAWLDMAIMRAENGWKKTMISEIDVNICKKMFRNFQDLKMFGIKIMDLLSSNKARWQWPVYWDGKKALFDCILVDIQGHVVPIDFKTTASLSQFAHELRAAKWVQSVHYEEGAAAEWRLPVLPMQFLVSSKSKQDLYLAQNMTIDEKSYDGLREKYQRLCYDYVQWETSGKPISGALDDRKIKIWTN